MNSTSSSTPPPKAGLVAWILWSALLVGMTLIHFQLAGEKAPAKLADSPIRFLPLAPLMLSLVVRFLLLPRLTTYQQGFPLWVIGLAMAEGCGLLGTFLAPVADARILYFASLFGMILYVPKFVSFLNPR